MIMINCCATCDYYEPEEKRCRNRENLSGTMRPEDSCQEWFNLEEELRQQESD